MTSHWPGGSSLSSPSASPTSSGSPTHSTELGEIALTPGANIIKLPNISASIPQLKAAVTELQAHGYDLPDFPTDPQTPEEHEIRAKYSVALGSAVNPVLRQGNSDRRAPKAVKEYARKNPHSMGAWSSDSKTHVATMGAGDFASNEQSVTVDAPTDVRIEHVGPDGTVTVLKPEFPLLAGEVIDSTVMSVAALRAFLAEQVADAKERGVLFSLHLKATMMKVSDPIIFGHAVEVFFADVFAKHGDALRGGRRQSEQRARWRAGRPRLAARPTSEPRSRRTSPLRSSPARTSPWSIPTTASPTCTCRATSSSTPRCRR